MTVGVSVGELVGVFVGVLVGVNVGVAVGVCVGVFHVHRKVRTRRLRQQRVSRVRLLYFV